MPKKITTILLLLFSLNTLSGCDFGDLRLLAQFNRINGLESGDRIIHQGKYIGDIEEITKSTRGHYLVELDVDSDHKEQLTVYSIFYIDNDPDYPDRKAVFTEQMKPGGILLTDDSVVAGSDHPPRLRNMLDDLGRKAEELATGLADKIERAKNSFGETSTEVTRQLEKSLAEIEGKLQDLDEEIRTAPDSDEARKLKRSIDKLVRDLETTLEQVGTTISRDLLSRLEKALADLQNRLEELNRKNHPTSQREELDEEVLTF
jgi:ABC-type transporter Mla subunit MlaD